MPEPIVESIEVAPSEETGNIPVETPSEQTTVVETPATPAEPVETVLPTEPELHELPDGRKVDASTVVQEYKNLLTDYTKKSQELAKTKSTETLPETKPANPLADPNYVPSTYAELAAQIEAQTLQKIEAKEKEKVDAHQAVENAVVAQLTEVKTLDPKVNENALFLHATKYGFRDLKLAHQNMKDMAELAKNVQKTTATNIAKRNDPVSVSPGATGIKLDPSSFATAVDYLRALKGQ